MGSGESKPLSGTSGAGCRGSEVTSTVPKAKEELVVWKIENISTLLKLAKESATQMPERFCANYNFQIEPIALIGWTKWSLKLTLGPRQQQRDKEYLSLVLHRDMSKDGDDSSTKWFAEDVFVKMELLPESNVQWPCKCCKGSETPFESTESVTANMKSEENKLGWNKFMCVDNLLPKHDHTSQHGATADDECPVLKIHLKLTFQYFHVDTTFRPLSCHEALRRDCENEFKKVQDAMFNENVKVISKLSISSKDHPKLSGNIAFEFKGSGKFIVGIQQQILSARSPVFKAMLEADMEERNTGIISIDDISHEPMLLLLEFVYTGNLPISGESREYKSWLKFPGEVVRAADKYQLPILKRFCEENLAEVCTKENAKALYETGRLYKFENAKKKIWEFIQRNLDSDVVLE